MNSRVHTCVFAAKSGMPTQRVGIPNVGNSKFLVSN